MNKPKVSIVTITYNHEKYVRDALESFLNQKTDFIFEIIIADDCSTDKTPDIIKEYSKNYPTIINPILRGKNIGAVNNSIDALKRAKGEYIALCEGDDYWTDDNKLQKQVDFLDKNKEYALCFHPVKVFFEDQTNKNYIFPKSSDKSKFTTRKLLMDNFIQTNSVMYRRRNYKNIPTNVMPLDWYLHLYHAQFGKIGFINQVMSAYRRHSGGIWYDTSKSMDEMWKKQGLSYLALFAALLKIYDEKRDHRAILNSQINKMFSRMIEIDKKYGTELMNEAIVKFPELSKLFIISFYHSVLNNEEEIKNLKHSLSEQNQDLLRLREEISLTKSETTRLLQTKSFRTGFYLLHPNALARRNAQLAKSAAKRNIFKLKQQKGLTKIRYEYRKKDFLSRPILRDKNTQIALIIHLYYTEVWQEFQSRLKLIDRPFDLFITLPRQHAEFAPVIESAYPQAYIILVPNHGRDVLPFMQLSPRILAAGYEYALKLHSKKSKHRTDGEEWLSDMVDKLLPENRKIMELLITTLNKKETAIVGPAGHYVSLQVNYEANGISILTILKKVYSKATCRKIHNDRAMYGFFAGTMFWMRLDNLKPLINQKFSIANYEIERGQIDGTFAHAMERAFCLIPEISNKKLYEIDGKGLHPIDYEKGIIPNWSDIYIGPKPE